MMSMRPVTMSDSEILFEWRNDPTTYQYCLSSKEVKWEDHLNWLDKVIASDDVFLFIIDDNGRPVGQVRFNVYGDRAEISITIGAKFRGKGLGSKAISHAIYEFLGNNSNIESITARIRHENKASIDMFQKLGFSVENQDDELIYMVYPRKKLS
jgi:UDP-2,4-diacetamido-2,4,6-trideoxy-beta-L-altropyranose hydrolase